MTLGEFLDRVKDLPSDALVCAAEVDEAFGMNIAAVEVVDNATVESSAPDGTESVQLENGSETVVVIRW
jgi:hypothetical protein